MANTDVNTPIFDQATQTVDTSPVTLTLVPGTVYHLQVGEWFVVQTFAGRALVFCDSTGSLHTLKLGNLQV